MKKSVKFDFIKDDSGKVYIAGYGNQYYNAKNLMNEKAYNRFEQEVNKTGKKFGVASTYNDYQRSINDYDSTGHLKDF